MNDIYTGGDYDISMSYKYSLFNSPNHITGEFDCNLNNLTSLICGPQIVDGDYNCSSNQLTDLVGCASHISGSLYCWSNKLTSFVGIHKIIKSCTYISFDTNAVCQGGIGLLLIENLIHIDIDTEPFEIINNYIGTGTKGMMACRAELIAKSYTNYAKL